MTLNEICLIKHETCQYKKKVGENYPIIITDPAGIKCIVRTNIVEAQPITNQFTTITNQGIDDLFIHMIDYASTIVHDEWHLEDPVLGIHNVVTEMGRWDCVPKNLLVPINSKIPEFQNEEFDSYMKGCTCCDIINSFAATFKLSVIKYNILQSKESVAYLLAEPSMCGYYNSDNGLKMLIKPVACFKMAFLKN